MFNFDVANEKDTVSENISSKGFCMKSESSTQIFSNILPLNKMVAVLLSIPLFLKFYKYVYMCVSISNLNTSPKRLF